MSNLAGHTLVATLLFALVALVGRLVYINAYHGPRLMARAERQQRSVIPIQARRGWIVDCVGRIISGTTLRKSVFADPHVIPDKQNAADVLSQILGVDAGEIVPDLMHAGDRRFFVIRRGVSDAQAEAVEAAGVYGLGTFTEPARSYPMGALAAQLIGFVAPDGVGVSGLEHQCDAWLRGESGMKTIVRDARRKAFWLAEGGYRPARDGLHVVLTIDTEIQANVERALGEAVERFRAESGMAVVMQPHTGAVLALANVPVFDPNQYRDFGSERYRNRVITDPFEPGSTFKPFIASAAMHEGVVRLGEVFDCENGSWTHGDRTLRDHHAYGFLTFEEVLIKSSNIGMGKIGQRLGNHRLYQYVKAFGFGEKTGIGLDGESSGIVRPLSVWGPFTTTSIPMGQEIGVTGIQLCRAYCAFANGGRLVTPYVLRAIMDADGRVVTDLTPPQADIQVLPEKIVNTMKDKILVNVVNLSSKKGAKLSNYQVFGKTGTAQIARSGGKGKGFEAGAYVSSFVGGAPAHDPQLVVLVAIRKPDKRIAYYGADVAAPVAGEILKHALPYLQVPPDPTPPPTSVTSLSPDEIID